MLIILKILDEKTKRTPKDIESQYPNCKYVLTHVTDLENVSGYLYCVSSDRGSLLDACKIAEDREGSIVMGSYNDGGAIGVQYEIKR